MSNVNNFISQFLSESVGQSIANLNKDDNRVNKQTEAFIGKLFERYITGNDGDNIPHVILTSDSGEFFAYNGKHYEVISSDAIQYIIKRVMVESKVGIVYQFNSHKKISDECILALQHDPMCKFNPDRRYAIFNNTVLDIEEQKLYPHDIKYKTDMVFDFDYKQGKRFPFWENFMIETIPDEGMRKAFQMYCGAFLANRNKFKIEYICLLVGKGANGKSVMAQAITGVFPKHLRAAYSPDQLFKSSQKEYYLADIDGKVVNYCDDVSNKDFSGGDFKAFTSGAEFTGRHAYSRSPMKVTRVPLMLCCVNEIPPTTDDTDGYFRRLLPILCPNIIPDDKKDVQLPEKLSTPEAKIGIFNWLLEGYNMLMKNHGKISISSSIKTMKDQIKNESNSIRRWISESGMYAVTPENNKDERWKPLVQWMKIYKDYCTENCEFPNKPSTVTKTFRDLGFHEQRRSDGTWFCIGKSQAEEPNSVVPASFDIGGDDDDFPF